MLWLEVSGDVSMIPFKTLDKRGVLVYNPEMKKVNRLGRALYLRSSI